LHLLEKSEQRLEILGRLSGKSDDAGRPNRDVRHDIANISNSLTNRSLPLGTAHAALVTPISTGVTDLSQIDFADPELKSETVGGIASRISTYQMVRDALLERQRRFAAQPGGAVLDGRDIGTVIAPEADVKLFVTASPEVRAQRRYAELKQIGMDVHYADVLADIRARDARDTGREAAPLLAADGAIILDTSSMSADEAIAAAIAAVGERAPVD